jgi:branched-chain amino acid transport system ATP-binding protein
MPEAVIELANVSVGYSGTDVVHDVSIAIESGERVALLGANGAGKSTLLKAMAGSHRPSSGQIRVNGSEVTGLRPDRWAHLGVRWLGDPRPIYPEMSIEDNLTIGGFSKRGELERRRGEIYGRFPELANRKSSKAGSLSGGQAQILAIAQSLMSNPKVLLMDEPSMGLSVAIIKRLGEIVEGLGREKVAVVWAEQFPDSALRYCNYVLVMAAGHVAPKIMGSQLSVSVLEDAYLGSALLPPSK